MTSWDPKELIRRDLALAAEMTARGIIRVPIDYFHYKSFRYTRLEDAIAQANRDLVPERVS